MAQLGEAQALGLQGRVETVKQNKQAQHWNCLSPTYLQVPPSKGSSGLLLGKDQMPNDQGYLGSCRYELDYPSDETTKKGAPCPQ